MDQSNAATARVSSIEPMIPAGWMIIALSPELYRALDALGAQFPNHRVMMSAPQSHTPVSLVSSRHAPSHRRDSITQDKTSTFSRTLRNHKAEANLMRAEFQRRLDQDHSGTHIEFLEEVILALYAIKDTVILVAAILDEFADKLGKNYYIPAARVRVILAKHLVPVVKKTPRH